MKSFEELEEQHQRSPLQVDDPKISDASGLLILAREKSEVVLSSSKPLTHTTDDSGWFDLRVRASNGEIILLRNAVTLETTSYGARNAFLEKIFPNIVVFRADHLGKDTRIIAITFSFPALKYFFYYQYFEWLGIHNADQKDLAILKKMRRAHRSRPDFSHPTELYVIHRSPRYLIRFQAGDRKYSVFSGHSSVGPSWNNIEVRTQPFATISFGTSVTIDEAIDHIWEWKRFFEQVSFQPLNVETISANSKGRRPNVSSDIYLPNVSTERADIHPGDIPLNLWKDRAPLSRGMQSWLSKEPERRPFRVAIARVIDRSRERASLDDIVTLCAAVESLTEFQEDSQLSSTQIDVLASAAQTAAVEQGIEVNPDRIRDLLQLLRSQSLPRRLKLLGRKLQPSIPKSDTELVMEVVRRLRTITAHGQSLKEIKLPQVAPAVQALLGMCVLYDLTTCSIPIKAREHSHIMAMKQVSRAIKKLRQLKSIYKNFNGINLSGC